MSKVYVPSLRYKNGPDGFVPTADITPAESFGEIVYLTTPGNNPVTQAAIDDLINKIDDITEQDYILLTGDVVLLGIALGEMAMRLDTIRVLRWDGREKTYKVEEWDWSPLEMENA